MLIVTKQNNALAAEGSSAF